MHESWYGYHGYPQLTRFPVVARACEHIHEHDSRAVCHAELCGNCMWPLDSATQEELILIGVDSSTSLNITLWATTSGLTLKGNRHICTFLYYDAHGVICNIAL